MKIETILAGLSARLEWAVVFDLGHILGVVDPVVVR